MDSQEIVLLVLLILLLLLLLLMLLSWLYDMHKKRKLQEELEEMQRIAMQRRMGQMGVPSEEDSEAHEAAKAELVRQILDSGNQPLAEHLKKMAGLGHLPPRDLNDPEVIRKIASRLDEADLRIIQIAADPRTTDMDLDVRTTSSRVESQLPTDDVEIRPISGPEELSEVLPEQAMLDDDQFYAEAAAGGLQKMTFHETVRNVVLLYLLLDGSGSMEQIMRDNLPKHVWARGVVAKMLLKAIDGSSKFFLRVFDEHPGPLHRATNRQEALDVLDKLHRIGFTGGGTNIFNAFSEAVEDIRNSGEFARAEIVIISDGEDNSMDDTARIKRIMGDDIKVHAILIGNDSPALKAIATSYVRI